MTWVVLFSFYRWGNWVLENLSNFPGFRFWPNWRNRDQIYSPCWKKWKTQTVVLEMLDVNEGQRSLRDEEQRRWNSSVFQLISCRKFPVHRADGGSPGRTQHTLWAVDTDLGVQEVKGARVYRAEYQRGKNSTERENSKALQSHSQVFSLLIKACVWGNCQDQGKKTPKQIRRTWLRDHTGLGIVPVLHSQSGKLSFFVVHQRTKKVLPH